MYMGKGRVISADSAWWCFKIEETILTDGRNNFRTKSICKRRFMQSYKNSVSQNFHKISISKNFCLENFEGYTRIRNCRTLASCVTIHLPVFETELQMVSLSHGRIETKSITSIETSSSFCAISATSLQT